jgi:methylphosphotriester-DNA--protein-cysteine methyltransferase
MACYCSTSSLTWVHFRDSRTESLSDRLRNCIRCVSDLFTQLQLPRNCINAVARIIQFHSGKPTIDQTIHQVITGCSTAAKLYKEVIFRCYIHVSACNITTHRASSLLKWHSRIWLVQNPSLKTQRHIHQAQQHRHFNEGPNCCSEGLLAAASSVLSIRCHQVDSPCVATECYRGSV